MTNQPEPQSDELETIFARSGLSLEDEATQQLIGMVKAWGRKQRADAIKSYKKVDKLIETEMTDPNTPTRPVDPEELHRAAEKAIKATNYCTKHGLYHGQKYKSCTPQERVLVEVSPKEPSVLDKSLKQNIETWLNKLPYVIWDRWSGDNMSDCSVFGWIERTDQYKDFVLIWFIDGEPYTFDTSSAKWSADIAERLDFTHDDCRRVEHDFDVNASIKLRKAKP